MSEENVEAEELSPQQFLHLASAGEPGWSQRYGGTLGVAQLAVRMQQQLAHQSEQISAIRAAAVKHQLKTRSGADLAREMGVSKTAVSRMARSQEREEITW